MEVGILVDIVTIFAVSTLVNILFNRIKTPSVVGYLLTGILLGPSVFGLVEDEHSIEILAELGIVFLLFTIGIEFSIKHLMKIRKVVFLGGFVQLIATAFVFFIVSKFYALDWKASLFLGFLAALSSSALVLKLLQERSELTSNYGRTVLGILIFQDLMLVPLLLFTNFLGSGSGDLSTELLWLLIKMIAILGVVYVGYRWIMPKLFEVIVKTGSQEVFMMAVFLIGVGASLITFELGMSLAFGAFLAGLMISESEYSHQAYSNLVPFKDIFTSFFFVSVGMLLNLDFVAEQYLIIGFSVIVLILLKFIIAGGTGFILGHTLKGTVLIGIALSQVGEFSFLLAKLGLDNSILDSYYYQLFLAVSIISMTLTPFLMRGGNSFGNFLLKLGLPKWLKEGLFPLPEMKLPDLQNHLVLIGKDTIAQKLSIMAKANQMDHISILFDAQLVKEKIANGEPAVYGDAINEPILKKAHVDTADIVVISVRNLASAITIIQNIRKLNPTVYIITSATQIHNIEELYEKGADQVIPEKFEIAVDLFNRVLVKRLYPQKDINRIINHLRVEHLGGLTEKDAVNKPSFLDEIKMMNISVLQVDPNSEADGKSLLELHLRSRTGVTVLAIRRQEELIEHPHPSDVMLAHDLVYVIGNPEQCNLAFELFESAEEAVS